MEAINTVGRRKAAVARIYVNEGKGQITINQKDYKEALDNFLSVRPDELDEDFTQILYLYMGRCLKELGDSDGALEYFRKAAGTSEGAARASYASLEIGDILIANGQYGEAVHYFDSAYGDGPSDEIKSFALNIFK